MAISKEKRAKGNPLTRDDLARLRAAVKDAGGEREAASRLGVPLSTLARALAGFGLRQGTVELIRARVEAAS